MSWMEGFHFGFPAALWALTALPLMLALFFNAERKRQALLGRFIAARLQPRLAGTVSVAKRRAGFALIALGLALAVVALARPQFGFVWEERTARGRDVLIAVDTSRSMLAQDPRPNRLVRARLAAQDLLAELAGDRVGLIAFAGSSFLQAPLTADFAAVRDSLNELDTEIIPRGGTNLRAAIEAANDAFGKGESEHRALIIFTDGEELEEDARAAAAEYSAKFRIFTVGIGSPQGALIPVRNDRGGTDFVRDEQGQYVTSKLDEARLREVAEAGGGFYIHLENGPAEMKRIATEGLGKMKVSESESQYVKKPVERYAWPLAGAILCLAASVLIGERRRVLLSRGAAAVVALLPAYAGAEDGRAQFEKGDYAGALQSYEAELSRRDAPELHYNAGNAAFQAGDYGKAAASFSRALGEGDAVLQARAAYNLGNTLARRGGAEQDKDAKIKEWKNAIQHYDRTLELDPNFKDAEHNREIVKKAIESLEKQEEQQEKKEEQKQEQQKQEQQKQEQQKQEQQEQQKQEQEQQSGDGKGQEQEQEQSGSKNGGDKQEKSPEQEKKEQQAGGEGEKQESQPEAGEEKEGDGKQQPKPEPGEEGEKKEGELKAANEGGNGDEKNPAEEAAEAAAAAREGRMTEKDAKQLLEAMRKFDQRVRLLDPREAVRRPRNGQFKDW